VNSTAAPTDDGNRGNVGDLHHAWQKLLGPLTGSPRVAAVGEALLQSWAEPSRRYHDATHLREVLRGVDELAGHVANLAAVQLAA
jgi:predicted metal-dependent HD superfamily phosphohydrolase